MAILYYYTTAETMKYILTQGDIFATHISYLNDSEEYVNGLRELRELFLDKKLGGIETQEYLSGDAYRETLKDIPEIYSISFSREADLLSQWYMYARESGVRLGMSFSQERQKFRIKQKEGEKEKEKQNGKDEKKPDRSVESVLKDVSYFTRIGMSTQEYENKTDAIVQMINDYAKEIGVENDLEANGIRLWKEIAPYIKNYEFRQEKEVRLIFNAATGGHGSGADLIEYRNANGVLVPYLDIYREEGWPVVEIMVGPGRNQERVFNSICHFVDNNFLRIPKVNEAESMRRFIGGMSSYQVKQNQIDEYCSEIERDVSEGKEIITYKGRIYDILSGAERGREYLDRNYYSDCGIIVRKSNAPYVFS